MQAKKRGRRRKIAKLLDQFIVETPTKVADTSESTDEAQPFQDSLDTKLTGKHL